MIHYIKGKITMKFDGGIVAETGGIGYKIFTPANSSLYLAKEHDELTIYTAMIVREDDISLYGFGEQESLDTFNKLITVNGVGAKAALAILSAMPIHEVQQAIVFEDVMALTRANGIGKKTAQRIVLDLKDKFDTIEAPDLQGMGDLAETDIPGDSRAEAVKALVALGYSKGEAINGISAVKETNLTTEEYIKAALKKLF